MRRQPNQFELKWINLAAQKLGTRVLFATDDFFAEKENLIKPEPAIFIQDKYTENGKWMDGWESRRKRVPGHDYAIIQLGLPGSVRGVDVDTSFFTGNHPPFASVEACNLPGCEDVGKLEAADWQELLPKSPLGPGQNNLFACNHSGVVSHIKLRIFPDGGVARLRIYGRADRRVAEESAGLLDLASVTCGALVLECNDMYFSPKDNMIMPYAPEGMFDGWETRRRREPGHDWSVLSLGARGVLKRIELDTAFFKGNYPDSFSVESANLAGDEDIGAASWQQLINQTKLSANNLHKFGGDILLHSQPVTHVRLNIFPDGGVARFRCLGEVC